MRDSYSLVCFSSLWFEKDSRLSHFKVFKDLKLHSALVFVLNVFPQWLLGSFLLTVRNVFNCSTPLINKFLPVSPAYLDTLCSHLLQMISYPTPVLRHTPTCPVLHGKHVGLSQCFLSFAPGTETPRTCPSCRPPLSCTLKEIFEPLSSSSQALFSSFASSPPCVGGTIITPSLMLVPRGSLLYQRSLFSCFLIRLPSSS